MRWFNNGRRRTVTGIAALGSALAMVVTGGVSYQLVTSTDAALTDVLTFGGLYKAKPEEIKPSGQWSYSVVSLDVEQPTKGSWNTDRDSVIPQAYKHELMRDFSAEAQTRQSSGGACVWGGAGESCNGTGPAEAASDATATGDTLRASWYEGSGANAYFQPSAPLTTGVRCTADGDASDLHADAPTGAVRHGNAWYAFNYGFQNFDVASQPSGTTVRHKVAWNTDTHTEVHMTKSHGIDESQHRAWSEVVVRVRGEHDGASSGWLTYTSRSECGISFNDGSGSTGPLGVSDRSNAGGFTNFLRSFVPWLDDDAEAKRDDEDATTTSEETTGSRAADDEKSTSASEKESATKSSTPRDEDEKSTSTSEQESTKESEKKSSTSRDGESPKSASDETTESKADRTSEPGAPATEDATTEPEASEPEVQEPLPTTAPGSPQSSGFSDASTLTLNGTAYQTLSTRELDDADVQTLADVEATALASIDDHVFTGTVGGAAWSYFSGSGMDVIEVRLADGSVVQLRLASHGAALPQPDVVKPTQDDDVAAPTEDDAAAPTQDDEE